MCALPFAPTQVRRAIAELEAKTGRKVATTVDPASDWWPAEVGG